MLEYVHNSENSIHVVLLLELWHTNNI